MPDKDKDVEAQPEEGSADGLSLHPLSPEEALRGFLQVEPEKVRGRDEDQDDTPEEDD